MFSPTGRNYYLNITPNNLVRMYSNQADGVLACQKLADFITEDFVIPDPAPPIPKIPTTQQGGTPNTAPQPGLYGGPGMTSGVTSPCVIRGQMGGAPRWQFNTPRSGGPRMAAHGTPLQGRTTHTRINTPRQSYNNNTQRPGGSRMPAHTTPVQGGLAPTQLNTPRQPWTNNTSIGIAPHRMQMSSSPGLGQSAPGPGQSAAGSAVSNCQNRSGATSMNRSFLSGRNENSANKSLQNNDMTSQTQRTCQLQSGAININRSQTPTLRTAHNGLSISRTVNHPGLNTSPGGRNFSFKRPQQVTSASPHQGAALRPATPTVSSALPTTATKSASPVDDELWQDGR